MSLKIEFVGQFNPFDFITCPLCGGDKFVSLSLASVWCEDCNTRFSVRSTAGDPGCVVDAFLGDAYAPMFDCGECHTAIGSIEASPICPKCKKPMVRREGYTKELGRKESFYWILKRGDYSSGWLKSGGMLERNGGDHQKDWDAFQKNGSCNLKGVSPFTVGKE